MKNYTEVYLPTRKELQKCFEIIDKIHKNNPKIDLSEALIAVSIYLRDTKHSPKQSFHILNTILSLSEAAKATRNWNK